MKFKWGFGREEQEFEVPDHLWLGTLEVSPPPPLENLELEIGEALSNPLASPPLSELLVPGDRVLVIAPDHHRLWLQVHKWMPKIISELNRGGIADKDITILIATGTHHKPDYSQLRKLLGEVVLKRVKVVVHDPHDRAQLMYLGKSQAGTPIWLNRQVFIADKIILTGGIVSHAFAGYGGGRKSIVPGIAGMKTILANHRLALSKVPGGGIDERAQPGVISGNPVSEDMLDIASRVNPTFLVNFVVSESGEFLKVFAGHWISAHLEGCDYVSRTFKVPLEEKADIVLASRGGYPMDLTFYQAFQSNANAQAALRENGILIMVGKCSEGLGPYEFHRWFDLGSPETIEKKLRENFTVPGFVVYRAALLAEKVRRLMLVSGLEGDVVKRIGIVPHSTIGSALKEARSILPQGRILLMPHASQTIPYLENPKPPRASPQRKTTHL